MFIEISLFNKEGWYTFKKNKIHELKKRISRIDGDELLISNIDELCDELEQDFSIDVPVLKDNITKNDVEEKNGRYGHKVKEIAINIPFEGNFIAFEIRPSHSYGLRGNTSADVRDQELILRFQFADLSKVSGEYVNDLIKKTISDIKSNLNSLLKDVSGWNNQINNLSRQLIESRREKLLAEKKLVESITFPLKERSESSITYFAPNVRRRITPTFPKASAKLSEREPSLAIKHYEHIISVIERMAIVMERNPYAFKDMSEEALRVLFLVALNGHYEGQATGETFNYGGKTDILIRCKDRNIFIGECKFWKGPKVLSDTIDQILGYSSWRDTKVAILIFNRNKNFSKVIKDIPETVEKHNNYKKSLKQVSETQFRYIFTHRDDPDKEMTLSILLFDVPK
ncbi:MAG: hypothetical protein PVH61_33500 [Candidatus Aminicenantes bacterium]|jgi:hypothetical protein